MLKNLFDPLSVEGYRNIKISFAVLGLVVVLLLSRKIKPHLTLEISPTSAQVGQSILVTGEAPADSLVTIFQTDGLGNETATLGQVTADSHGLYSASVQLKPVEDETGKIGINCRIPAASGQPREVKVIKPAD